MFRSKYSDILKCFVFTSNSQSCHSSLYNLDKRNPLSMRAISKPLHRTMNRLLTESIIELLASGLIQTSESIQENQSHTTTRPKHVRYDPNAFSDESEMSWKSRVCGRLGHTIPNADHPAYTTRESFADPYQVVNTAEFCPCISKFVQHARS